MPRSKKDNSVLELELRITPPDGNRIVDWQITDDIEKLVAYEEGGLAEDKKLHYHCYVVYRRSRTLLTKWIYTIARCIDTGETGNAVFFSRKPHDHTFGYICKQGNLTVRHNVPQTTIDEWIAKSRQYVTDKETQRKRKQRTRESELQEIFDNVQKHLKERNDYSSGEVVSAVLSECDARETRFPSRSQMESFVLRMMYRINSQLVIAYFNKSFFSSY